MPVIVLYPGSFSSVLEINNQWRSASWLQLAAFSPSNSELKKLSDAGEKMERKSKGY